MKSNEACISMIIGKKYYTRDAWKCSEAFFIFAD